MMPTIRIDNEIWNHLKSRAEPFEDTPNTVLRRLLRLEKKPHRGRKMPAGSRTPQAAYRMPILAGLAELGGRATTAEVLDCVEKRLRSVLRPIDLEKISTGMVRWRNAAMWERKSMVDEGLLASGSPRGLWELTAKGREFLRKAAAS